MQLSTIRLRIWRRQCSQICFGHRLSRALWHGLLAAHLVFMAGVQAAPQGGVIRGGHGTISRADLMTHIQQNSQLMAIDWQRFDVAADEQVNFTQPNQQAIALNRILGNNASQIFGQVNANGHLVLVNPRGIFFGDTARVNVGGLIASGLDIDPDRFMNGDFTFSALEGTDGQVINSGLIQAATGGSVTLLGQQVRNDGLIVANLGAVNMAAGTEAVVSFERDGLLGVKITKEVLQEDLGIDPAVLNTGEIQAQGGRVLLTGSVSQDIFSQAVNIGELKEARSAVVHEDGSFTLGAGADVVNKGRIDVSSAASDAGQVVMLGENVTHSGQILADASGYNSENPNSQNQGGQVELHASDTTSLTDDSLIAARSEHGEGGDVFLLGNKVGLFDHSVVDVSGGSQGGQVLIGGDRQGLNSLVRNAEFVYLGEHSQVFADALNHGNGGKVITFAEDTARIYGGLYARGGQQGGDGGFIETSGLRGFEINTVPDVSAAEGRGGLWLIDPYNITIVAGNEEANINNRHPFESTNDGARLGVTLISDALTGGTNVTVTTGTGGTSDELGDIIWGENFTGANLNINSTGTNTLTLNAANDIVFTNGAIFDVNTGSADSLNLVLNAGKDITFSDTNNIVINTSGGYLDFTATGAVDLGTATLDTDGGSQAVGSATPVSFLSNSGSFISTNATINTTGAENTDGGAINITTTTGNITTGGLTANGGEAVKLDNSTGAPGPNGGNITLTANAGAVTVGGEVNSNGSNGFYGSSNGDERGQPGGNGGDVLITADSLIKVKTGATVMANGGHGSGDNNNDAGKGGDAGSITFTGSEIELNADLMVKAGLGVGKNIGDGTTVGNGNIDAAGGEGKVITLTANKVRLNANLDVIATDPNGVTDINGSGARHKGNDGTVNVVLNGDSGSATIGYTKDFSSKVNVKVDGVATGSPTLVGANRKNDWDIKNTGGGELKNGDVTNVTFSGIGNLTGGSDDDSFVFSNSAAISGTIDGGGEGADGDSISGRDGNNSWTLTAANIGNVALESTPSTPYANFQGIETLKGSATTVTDSLTGRNQDNTWVIDGDGSGTVAETVVNPTMPTDNVAFFNMDRLAGNDGNDTFRFTNGVAFGGAIDGGDHVTGDRVDYSLWADGYEVDLSSVFNGVVNVERIIGNNNGTLIGENDFTNTWTLDAESSDSSFSQYSSTSGTTVRFAGFGTLTGGNKVDNFGFAASYKDAFDGTLNGGAGNDTFNLSSNSVKGNVNGDNDADQFTIGVSIGGSVNGGGANDRFDLTTAVNATINGGEGLNNQLAVSSGTNIWVVTDSNQGTVTDGIATRGVGFSNIQNLRGGSGDDRFNINSGVIGIIEGGGQVTPGGDTLRGQNIDSTWTLAGAYEGKIHRDWNSTLYLKRFSGIETLEGGTAIDTLVGRNQDNTWMVTNDGVGTVAETVTAPTTPTDTLAFSGMNVLTGGDNDDRFILSSVFNGMAINGGDATFGDTLTVAGGNGWNISGSGKGTVKIKNRNNSTQFDNIENLTGGVKDDIFSFGDKGVISGIVDAGDHIDGDLVDYSLVKKAVSISLVNAFNGVLNAEQISGNMGSTLIGKNESSTWTIENEGSTAFSTYVEGGTTIKFRGFDILKGGDKADKFILNADVIDSIDGGGESDILTLMVDNMLIQVGTTLNSNSENFNITQLESVTGASGSTQDKLFGDNRNSTWQITNTASGTLSDAANGTVTFNGINAILAGNGNDTFTFDDGVNFAGSIDAGGHVANEGDTVNLSAWTTVSVDLDTFAGDFVRNAEIIIGNGTGTLEAWGTQNNTWNLAGTNVGNVEISDSPASNVQFQGFSLLQGGALQDEFKVGGRVGTVTSIRGGGGDDVLRVTWADNGGNIIFDGEGHSTVTGDQVELVGGNANWQGTFTPGATSAEGQFNYTHTTAGGLSIAYSNAEGIQDNAIADRYTLNGTAANDTLRLKNSNEYWLNSDPLRLQFRNKTNLFLAGQGGNNDIVQIDEAITVADGILGIDAEIIQGRGLITAAELQLSNFLNVSDGGGGALNTSINKLWARHGSGDINLLNSKGLQITQLDTVGSVDINANGAIRSPAALEIIGGLSLRAGGEINLGNSGNRIIGPIMLISTGASTLSNSTTTLLSAVSASSLTVNSAGDLQGNDVITVNGQTRLSAKGNIALLSAANDFNVLTINAAANATIRDQNSLTLNGVSVSGDLDITSESLVINNSVSAANVGFDAGSGSVIQSGGINANTDVSVLAGQSINMSSGTTTNASGNVNYSAGGNVNLAHISAGNTASVDSGGQIIDSNGEFDNLVAARVALTANSGIGAGDQLELQTSNLDASNGSGLVSLANTGAIDISRLHNGDNIDFSNDLDINMASGSVNANRNDLNMLTLTGSFLGLGQADLDNVDITAGDATFIGLVGTFGTFDRPLVLDVSGTLTLQTRTVIEPVFPRGEPSTINNNALITINSFDATSSIAGSQLTEIEELLEIDLAVFTAVRNYDYAQTAIRLPRDQLYEGE